MVAWQRCVRLSGIIRRLWWLIDWRSIGLELALTAERLESGTWVAASCSREPVVTAPYRACALRCAEVLPGARLDFVREGEGHTRCPDKGVPHKVRGILVRSPRTNGPGKNMPHKVRGTLVSASRANGLRRDARLRRGERHR